MTETALPIYEDSPTVSPLRLVRIARGLSQDELARLAGVNRSTVSRLEQGHEEPQRATKAVLAAALAFPAEKLFPEDDRDPASTGPLVTTTSASGVPEDVASG